MATDHDKLPGGCFVKQIKYSKHGIILKPGLLNPNGFNKNQTATLLISEGKILITLDANQQNILTAIQELQFRQDEMQIDFGPAIKAMQRLVTV